MAAIAVAAAAGLLAAAQFDCIRSPVNGVVDAATGAVAGLELYVLLGVLAGAVAVYSIIVAVTTVRYEAGGNAGALCSP